MKIEVAASCLAVGLAILLPPTATAQQLPLLRKNPVVYPVSGHDNKGHEKLIAKAFSTRLSDEDVKRDKLRAYKELFEHLPNAGQKERLHKEPSRRYLEDPGGMSLSPSPSPNPSHVYTPVDVACTDHESLSYSFLYSYSNSYSFSYYSYSFSFPSLDEYGACSEGTVFEPLSTDDPEVENIVLASDSLYEVALPFDFNWLGQTQIPEGSPIGISPLGEIYIYPQGEFSLPPVHEFRDLLPIGFVPIPPRIAFFHTLLEMPSESGETLVKSSPSSLLVSFQNTALQPWAGGGGNAQVELFPSGRVSLCFGGGVLHEIPMVAGLEDYTLGITVPLNDTDVGFGVLSPLYEGVTLQWPTCYCFCYEPTRDNTINPDPPTPQVTCPPTASPDYSYSFDMSMSFPSSSPTESSCTLDTHFEPLEEGQPGVKLISLGDDDVHQLELPFDFYWMGRTWLPAGSQIGITSNGQINMESWDLSAYCCSPIPTSEWFSSYPGIDRIAFAQTDLDPSLQGLIFVRSLPSSLLVSFEEVPFFGSSDGKVNVQVELFPSGRVQICYGGGSVSKGESFVAALEYHNEENIVIPVTNAEFLFDEYGEITEWPTCYCFCYTPPPSISQPTSQPTSSPSPTPSGCPSGAGFEPIDLSMEDVTQIFPFAIDDGVESVKLPFDFNWVGEEVIPAGSAIGVSTNGQININGAGDSNCCSADPIDGSSYGGPRIAFVQSDLFVPDPPAGQVLVRSTHRSFLVSFQGVVWFGARSDPFNVQVELFPSGAVTICYGSGFPYQEFAAGVEDPAKDVFAPVTDAKFGFGPNGVNNGERWPEGYCWCYDPITPPTAVDPSASPTTNIILADCTMESEYSPLLQWMDDVTELFLGDDDAQPLELPFDFEWLGQRVIPAGSNIVLASNGHININSDDFTSLYATTPFDGVYPYPRIAFSQTDLNPSLSGQIFVRSRETSLLVSYQKVPFYFDTGSDVEGNEYEVNVQAELFPNGVVTVCFGPGRLLYQMAVGLEDADLGVSEPANGEVFEPSGVADSWPPAGYYYCYEPQMVV